MKMHRNHPEFVAQAMIASNRVINMIRKEQGKKGFFFFAPRQTGFRKLNSGWDESGGYYHDLQIYQVKFFGGGITAIVKMEMLETSMCNHYTALEVKIKTEVGDWYLWRGERRTKNQRWEDRLKVEAWPRPTLIKKRGKLHYINGEELLKRVQNQHSSFRKPFWERWYTWDQIKGVINS